MYVHGDSIKEETIVALRLVKYYLCKVGGALKVKITTKLLDLVKTSYNRYETHLAAQWELEEKLGKEK